MRPPRRDGSNGTIGVGHPYEGPVCRTAVGGETGRVAQPREDLDALAHDLNNLLTTIVGGAELLVQSLPEGQERHDAEEIRAAGRRAADLVRQLPNVATEEDVFD